MLNYIRLMRPSQWIKNTIVLAGPAFGLRFLDIRVAIVFAAFCLVASASYVINDIVDREADKAHPTKRNRPIAAGKVSAASALVWAVILFLVAAGGSYAALPRNAVAIVVIYFFLILAYSLFLKKRPILDVVIIAVGFVLRAVAGAEAVAVFVSPWLMICTFTLCMFMGFGKRRCELAIFTDKEEANAHRSTLLRYTPELLSHLTSVSAGIAVMTFLLYTMDVGSNAPAPPFAKQYLLYTLPLVVYGVFRYAMLIETGKYAGPTEILIKDKALLATCVLWAVCAMAIIVTTTGSEQREQCES